MRTKFIQAAAALALIAAGCSASGPDAVSDGTYHGYAASNGSAPSASLVIEGNTATFSIDSGAESYSMRDAEAEYVLCPPDGQGTPLSLGSPLAIGSTDFSQPAVFGDCGETAPERITLVDLGSYDEAAGGLPFGTWMEFCNAADDDC